MQKKNEYIYGIRPIIEAISAGKTIEKLLLKKGMKGALYHELMQEVNKYSLPYQQVPVERLNRITGKNHQGAIAYISAIEYHDLSTLLPGIFETGRDPFILILNNISDVRNFGAIARSAECFGVDCIVVPEKGSARINAEAVKTSAGALNRIPVARIKSILKTLIFLRNSGLKIISASEKGDHKVNLADLAGPTALVMGSEDRGISPEIIDISDIHLTIPMAGSIDSLNVSVAAGILMYEIANNR